MAERLTTRARFATTLWSVVLQAGRPDEPAAADALADLCQRYWKPAYVFLRRRGLTPEAAEDATQSFFVHLLEKQLPARVEPGRGRFRSYLLTALKHHLANADRVARAAKRGGGARTVSIDAPAGERDLRMDPADTRTPEDAFSRAWALEVLEQALGRLATTYAAQGEGAQFETIQGQLLAGRATESYAALAARLDCSVTQVARMMHKARERLRREIRAGLADTVSEAADLESEIGELFSAL